MIQTKPIQTPIRFKREFFIVTDPDTKIYGLSNTPRSESETLTLNGLDQLPGLSEQYIISNTDVVINSDVKIKINDVIAIHYIF